MEIFNKSFKPLSGVGTKWSCEDLVFTVAGEDDCRGGTSVGDYRPGGANTLQGEKGKRHRRKQTTTIIQQTLTKKGKHKSVIVQH